MILKDFSDLTVPIVWSILCCKRCCKSLYFGLMFVTHVRDIFLLSPTLRISLYHIDTSLVSVDKGFKRKYQHQPKHFDKMVYMYIWKCFKCLHLPVRHHNKSLIFLIKYRIYIMFSAVSRGENAFIISIILVKIRHFGYWQKPSQQSFFFFYTK